jgi:methyl-accepting chemotaxis protein
VNLQFHDRVDQIIGHVIDDMQHIEVTLTGIGDATTTEEVQVPDANDWMHRLLKNYTTLEQRQIHQGSLVSEANVESAEVTFF